jgi:hypothetical protein
MPVTAGRGETCHDPSLLNQNLEVPTMRQPSCQVADWFEDTPVPTYLVRLIDCTDSIDAAGQSAVTAQLTTWLTRADSTRSGNAHSSVRVEWAHSVASTTFANLVVYFVTNRRHSVIRHMRRFATPTHWDNLSGYTNSYDDVQWRQRGAVRTYTRDEHLSGCEVYTSKCSDAAALVMFAFHEAMHNQLHMGDEMHDDPVAGGGIAAARLKPGTTPSQGNLAAYGAAMGTIRPQWIDGYARAHPAHATHPLHPHH